MTRRNPDNQFGPTRRIVSRRRFTTIRHKPGTCSVELYLECGHVLIRKGSQDPFHSVHCKACRDTRA